MIKFREGEKIYEIKRRHRFIIIKDLFIFAFIFISTIIGMLLLFFVSVSFPEWMTQFIPGLLEIKFRVFALFYLSLVLTFCWQIAFIVFASYYLDSWIITNQRTIHTELRSLFSRIISSIPHYRIQDVTVDVNGFLPTILKFGDLQLQTAGQFHEFIFKQIPEPYETKEVIYRAKREDEINRSSKFYKQNNE